MATITDNDLKMFQERARTEFASRCDTGGIAWDSVIWDLCNEVRRLRGVSKESGNAAKLREALVKILWCLEWMFNNTDDKSVQSHLGEPIALAKSALAATEKEGGAK